MFGGIADEKADCRLVTKYRNGDQTGIIHHDGPPVAKPGDQVDCQVAGGSAFADDRLNTERIVFRRRNERVFTSENFAHLNGNLAVWA